MIELSPEEWEAVDSPWFQRLRSIRQLAMTHLVYPGAVHTRFEHSVGVRYVAGRLADQLEIKGDELAVVNTAALLHDVGHGPFSHISEQVIDELSGAEGVHEAVSAHIFRTDERIRAALGKELCDRAAELVALEIPRTHLRDVVSGPTDADKLDYLLRDSYFAGVQYGNYDIDKVIESATVIGSDTAQPQLGFHAGGVWAVEGLLLARHHMHRQVYGHKTRLATDIMITRALRFGIEEDALPRDAYEVQTDDGKPVITDEFLEGYFEQTDHAVVDSLLKADEATRGKDLIERLMSRNLLRRSVSIRLDERIAELGDAVYAGILDREKLTPARVAEMEERLAAELGLEPHLVGFYLDAWSNPTYRGPTAAIGAKEILFERHDGPPRVLAAQSEVFQQTKGLEHVYAYLFTPELSEVDQSKAKGLLWQELKNPDL